MNVEYLLPCPCGQKIPVTRPQAGTTVRCSCGKSQTVPGLLEMQSLEPVEPDDGKAAPGQNPWGSRHATALLGATIFVLAAAATLYLYWTRPIPPDFELVRERIQHYSPMESVQLWDALQRHGLTEGATAREEQFQKRRAWHQIWFGLSLAIALVGLVVLLVPMVWWPKAHSSGG